MSTLAKVLKSMIEKGRTEGIEEKIDVFYAAGKLTQEEYEILVSLLHPAEPEEPEEPEEETPLNF